jgi:hypothetical protein
MTTKVLHDPWSDDSLFQHFTVELVVLVVLVLEVGPRRKWSDVHSFHSLKQFELVAEI